MAYRNRTSAGAAALSASLLLLAACADPTSPTPTPASSSIRASGGSGAGYVDVCKREGPANIPFSFTVTNSLGIGYTPVSSFELLVGQCANVWIGTDPAAPVTMITVSEVNLPAGVELDRIEVLGNPTPIYGTNSASVPAQTGVYQMIKFYNKLGEVPPPPPPPSKYGCTPGYWKQDQHFGNWTGYSPEQLYNDVFGVSVMPSDRTLLGALSTGGGGTSRFGRHTTAALLSASKLGSLYGMTTAEVISAVQTAVASGPDAMDALSSRLAALNERSCPLGRAE